MDAHPAPSHQVVRRYFERWNTGDTAAATDVLATGRRDHAHPEVAGPADVQRAVTRIRARSNGGDVDLPPQRPMMTLSHGHWRARTRTPPRKVPGRPGT